MRGAAKRAARLFGALFLALTPLVVAETIAVALDRAPEAPAVVRKSPAEDAAMASGGSRLQPDPDALWTLRPGAPLCGDAVTSEGYRGSGGVPRDPAALRIVVLGDGATLGADFPEEETWPRRLETLLRRNGRPCQVINLAVDGYTIEQGIVRYRAVGRDLDPHVVVAAFGTAQEAMSPPNRMSDRDRMRRVARDTAWRRFLRRYALYRWCAGEEPPAAAANRVPVARFEEAVAELAELVREDGRRLVLVVPPRRVLADRQTMVTPLYAQAMLRAGGAAADVYVADAAGAVRVAAAEQGEDELLAGGFEPTAAGHRVVAQTVALCLHQAGLLDR